MKQSLTIQKSAPFSKDSFPILRKTCYLTYFTESKVGFYYDEIKFKDLNFEFSEKSPENYIKYLKGLNLSKAAGIDNLSGKFPKDGADILARPICQSLYQTQFVSWKL